jgi:hypothetical protein
VILTSPSHLQDCQRTSGAAHTTNVLVKDKDLHVTGSTVTNYVSPAKSGNPVTRTFCNKCGSAISHKSTGFGDATAVQTGTMLEHFKNVPFGVEIWTNDRWSGVTKLDVPQHEGNPEGH